MSALWRLEIHWNRAPLPPLTHQKEQFFFTCLKPVRAVSLQERLLIVAEKFEKFHATFTLDIESYLMRWTVVEVICFWGPVIPNLRRWPWMFRICSRECHFAPAFCIWGIHFRCFPSSFLCPPQKNIPIFVPKKWHLRKKTTTSRV